MVIIDKESVRLGLSPSTRGIEWASLLRESPRCSQEELGAEGRRLAKMFAPASPEPQTKEEQSTFILDVVNLRMRSLGGLTGVQRAFLKDVVEHILLFSLEWDAALVISVLLVTELRPDRQIVAASQRELEAEFDVFRSLVASTMPKTFSIASQNGMLDACHLSKCFGHCFVGCIPTPDLLRVFDASVAEGGKILHRFALAFFSTNKRAIKSLNMTADELWSSAGNMRDKIFEHAYNPRRTFLRSLMVPFSRKVLADARAKAWKASTSISSDESKISAAATSEISLSSNLLLSRPELVQPIFAAIVETRSVRSSMDLPVYQLSRDGAGISILRSNLSKYRSGPMLIIIKLRDGGVVGAFLSRHLVGDGHTLLFSNCTQDQGMQVFHWRGAPGTGSQFCHVTSEHVVFGDSGSLIIDGCMDYLSSSNSSATFNHTTSLLRESSTRPAILDLEVVIVSP